MGASTEYRLGKRELEIMNVVWDLGEATVQDVCVRLARSSAYSTILTMMRTLEAKGLLSHTVRQRMFVYRPEVPREDVRKSILTGLCDLLFGGSPLLLVNSLLAEKAMTEPELRELDRMMKRSRRKKRRT
jgi:BlaI family penicillinase repressor